MENLWFERRGLGSLSDRSQCSCSSFQEAFGVLHAIFERGFGFDLRHSHNIFFDAGALSSLSKEFHELITVRGRTIV